MSRIYTIAVISVAVLLFSNISSAALITDLEIFQTSGKEVGSGNGTLDLLLFTESSGGSGNSSSGFDGDDSNTDMPTGGGGGNSSVSVFYITSIGDIRDYYELNFSADAHDIVLFVDLNQTANGDDIVLDTLTVVVDYTADFGDLRDTPAGNDISSTLQNSTTGYNGGTVVANLDGSKTLPLNQQGAGFADYAIFLGIDPYDEDYTDSTRILVQWESTGHDDGGESIFLSGIYEPVKGTVPEPTTMVLLALGSLAAIRRRR